MMEILTRRQEEILCFLAGFQARYGRTPGGPEIAEHFGFSDHSSAYDHLKALERKGYIELIQPGKRRQLSIRLTNSRYLPDHWPLAGRIPAGSLEEGFDEDTDYLQKLNDLVPSLKTGDYLLMVEGDSMIDAGLEPGQYIVLRPDIKPENGEICAVWIEGEGGTLKRVYPGNDHILLVPENSRYESREYPADQVRIQGVLVAALAVKMFR